MVRQDVEVVRSVFDAWNSGDMQAFRDGYAEDAVLVTDPRFPEGGTFEGTAEVERFFDGLRQGWEGGRSYARDPQLSEAGERVMATFEWRGTGETSGIDVFFDTTALFTVRGNRIAQVEFYFDHDEALKAAGLAG